MCPGNMTGFPDEPQRKNQQVHKRDNSDAPTRICIPNKSHTFACEGRGSNSRVISKTFSQPLPKKHKYWKNVRIGVGILSGHQSNVLVPASWIYFHFKYFSLDIFSFDSRLRVQLVRWKGNKVNLGVPVIRRSRIASLAISTRDNRWSDVVPPNAALTFAVLWDPEEEIVAFSGANLLDSLCDDAQSPISPTDAFDNRSQVLTIGNSTIPFSENTGTLAFFRDNYEFLFSARTPLTLERFRRTQTSSTLEGLDVYLRGSMLGKAHPNHRRFSFLDELEADIKFDPRTSFANMWYKKLKKNEERTVTGEGYEEGPMSAGSDRTLQAEYNLCSAFSTTTTSTSNYVSVDMAELDDEGSSSWSDLEAPNTPSYSRLLFTDLDPHRLSKRLRKSRHRDTPAPPSEVLNRPTYNHVSSSPGSGTVTPCKPPSLPRYFMKDILFSFSPSPSSFFANDQDEFVIINKHDNNTDGTRGNIDDERNGINIEPIYKWGHES
ncbi:hypothetical protein BDZ94DRAFT_1240487 [Collybia nuda]|uniref:Uncharacterized protein n=1 Tax=Collybia nuda TaxID=64659 RepID=A0A9P6CE90_9AGAR|nr:hypothetical protein BDZ94DRAFT_1240487 [Collybia nuda]